MRIAYFLRSPEEELELEPMNSSRRRRVHKIAVKYTLRTEPRGEDRDRYVCLVKTSETTATPDMAAEPPADAADAAGEDAAAAGEDAARYIHLGATTQDIIDTAAVLQIRAAAAIVRRDLVALARVLAKHARAHRVEPLGAGERWAALRVRVAEYRVREQRLVRDQLGLAVQAGAHVVEVREPDLVQPGELARAQLGKRVICGRRRRVQNGRHGRTL